MFHLFAVKLRKPFSLCVFQQCCWEYPKYDRQDKQAEIAVNQQYACAGNLWYLCHTKTVKLSKEDFKLKAKIISQTLALGICSFLSQISLVAAMAAINNMIRKYGALDTVFGQEQYAQIPMAVVGIVMKFFQIVISIVVGMAAGCIPIVGFNMGGKTE